MESIREGVAKSTFYGNDKPITLTVSMGMASTEETQDKERLLDLADRKLYHAKQSGRNQIAV